MTRERKKGDQKKEKKKERKDETDLFPSIHSKNVTK